jgi:hypothetical protein
MNDSDYPYRSPPMVKEWKPGWPPEQLAGDAYAPPGISLLGIVAAVLAISSIGNVTLVPVSDAVNPGSLGFVLGLAYICSAAGAIGAQAALLAMVAVWGSGPLWQRLMWKWGMAAVLFLAWGLGFAMTEWNWLHRSQFPPEELVVAILGLPLLSLACQAAPWLFRIYFRWRIERPGEAAAIARTETITIRDFLVGTILVAVTMAAVRLGKPNGADETGYWAGWGIGAAAAAGIALLYAIPVLYLTLGASNLRRGALGVAALAFFAAAIAVTTMIGFLKWFNVGGGGPNDKELAVMISSLVFGFTATLAGTLWIARAYGYRLVTERPLMSPFGPPSSTPPAS